MLTPDEYNSLSQQEQQQEGSSEPTKLRKERKLSSLSTLAGNKLHGLLSPTKHRGKKQRGERSSSTSSESKDERDAIIERQQREIEELRARCEVLQMQLDALTSTKLYK